MAKSFLQRVVDEKTALDIKIRDLSNFRCVDEYLELTDYMKGLLTKQLDIMEQYSRILQDRINDFNK